MKTQIIDNALKSEDFERIQHALLSNTFPWSWNDSIARNIPSLRELKGLEHHEFGAQIIKARDEDSYYLSNQLTSETLNKWPYFQPLLRLVIKEDSKYLTDQFLRHWIREKKSEIGKGVPLLTFR